MRKKLIGIFVCILLIITGIFPVAGMISKNVNLFNNTFENQIDMKFIPGEIIVKLKNETTLSDYSFATLNEKYQVNDFEKVFTNAEGTILDNIYLLHVPIGSDILSIVREYILCPDVVYAESNDRGYYFDISKDANFNSQETFHNTNQRTLVNEIMGCSNFPNDINFSNQWHLHNTGQVFLPDWENQSYSGTPDADIDAPEAWEITTGTPAVVIAIIDSGVDYTHPDLTPNIWSNVDEIPGNGIDDDQNGYIDDVRGWDFFYNDSDPKDVYGHGTLCAGVAGEVGNNSLYGSGVAWNCKIMPVCMGNESGYTTLNSAKSIRYAADNGANVISMSWGRLRRSFTVKYAIEYAYKKGVFLCAAAGNGNTWIKSYPAAYDHVVAVAATNQNDRRCTPKDWPWNGGGGSNYGFDVDIAAPGNIIYSTMPTYHVPMNDMGDGLNFDWECGTSLACPMVAGVAALLLSINPSLTPDEIKTLLCKNVDPYYSNKYIGTGRVNAYMALADLITDIDVEVRGGLRVKAVIRNEGTSELTDLNWQIQVKGGIFGLKNKTFIGSVDIPAGKSVRVHTGLLFGFGSIVINVRTGIYEKTVIGTQRFIFTKIK